MPVLYEEYRARYQYRCAICQGEIPKGSRYVRAAQVVRNGKSWRVIRVHGRTPSDCPDHRAVNSEDHFSPAGGDH